MKKVGVFAIGFLLSFSTLVSGQESENNKDYIWSCHGRNKPVTVGLYGGLNTTYSEICGNPAGWLGAMIGVVFNQRWGIGISGNALWYDYRLDEIVSDGTYHLEGGYTGIFIEYLIPIGERVKLGLSITSGQGILQYKYDNKYAEEKIWYEEIIDQDSYAVFEPAVECMVRVNEKWWVGVNGSYRNTSPVVMPETKEMLLNGFNGGITVRYGIF